VIIPDDEAAAPTAGKRWILVDMFASDLSVNGNLNFTVGGSTVDIIRDENDMAADDAAALATQQSIKAYVDTEVAAHYPTELQDSAETGAVYTAGADLQLNYDDTLAAKTSASGLAVYDSSGDEPTISFHGDDENHIGGVQGKYDTDMWITTEENDSEIWFGAKTAMGTIRWVGLLGTDDTFRPATNKSVDLGSAAIAWDDVYADDYNNVADFYWMDTRKDEAGKKVEIDDVQIIKDIQPSNKYDPVSGLNIIDDSTLPTWLVKKHKKDGKGWKKGDTALTTDGKPYLSLKTINSLLMGAIRQLDARLTALEENK
jgi:hypothetical protein